MSGEAFRFICEPTRFFPTFFHCAEDIWENFSLALGYDSELVWDIDAGEATERVQAELAAGHIVLTCGPPGV